MKFIKIKLAIILYTCMTCGPVQDESPAVVLEEVSGQLDRRSVPEVPQEVLREVINRINTAIDQVALFLPFVIEQYGDGNYGNRMTASVLGVDPEAARYLEAVKTQSTNEEDLLCARQSLQNLGFARAAPTRGDPANGAITNEDLEDLDNKKQEVFRAIEGMVTAVGVTINDARRVIEELLNGLHPLLAKYLRLTAFIHAIELSATVANVHHSKEIAARMIEIMFPPDSDVRRSLGFRREVPNRIRYVDELRHDINNLILGTKETIESNLRLTPFTEYVNYNGDRVDRYQLIDNILRDLQGLTSDDEQLREMKGQIIDRGAQIQALRVFGQSNPMILAPIQARLRIVENQFNRLVAHLFANLREMWSSDEVKSWFEGVLCDLSSVLWKVIDQPESQHVLVLDSLNLTYERLTGLMPLFGLFGHGDRLEQLIRRPNLPQPAPTPPGATTPIVAPDPIAAPEEKREPQGPSKIEPMISKVEPPIDGPASPSPPPPTSHSHTTPQSTAPYRNYTPPRYHTAPRQDLTQMIKPVKAMSYQPIIKLNSVVPKTLPQQFISHQKHHSLQKAPHKPHLTNKDQKIPSIALPRITYVDFMFPGHMLVIDRAYYYKPPSMLIIDPIQNKRGQPISLQGDCHQRPCLEEFSNSYVEQWLTEDALKLTHKEAPSSARVPTEPRVVVKLKKLYRPLRFATRKLAKHLILQIIYQAIRYYVYAKY